MTNEELDSLAIARYKNIAADMIKLIQPEISYRNLDEALNYSIQKRFKNFNLKIHNNYTDKIAEGTALEMVNYIESRKPIITSAGVMWSKHSEIENPLLQLLQKFIDNRVKAKAKMFEYPVGSEMFQKYNLVQLLAKIDANALYGALGQFSCLFYNIFVAESVTTQGRSYTSASLLFFEAFLANNVKFGSLNEVIMFIHNVIGEKNERKYKDKDILDHDILPERCWYKIMMTAGFYWIPTRKEMDIVYELISSLSQEDINRLYYKNNLYEFFSNTSMKKALLYILKSLKRPFLDPNIPPEEIKVELDELVDIVYEYVYYGYQYIDRLDRVKIMPRDIDIVTDTDSNIICLDRWYRFVLNEIVKGNDLKIAHQINNLIEFIHVDEFGDQDKTKPIRIINPDLDYNFMDDEVIEKERHEHPLEITAQDGLRHSIINIMGYICSYLIVDYMERYTKNSYSYDPSTHKCKIIMKNEFLFKRLLATDGMKNYADIRELQEGKPVSKSKSLAIMGLNIDKSTLPSETRKELQKILYEDILDSKNINLVDVLKKLKLFEKNIIKLLESGDKRYYKPATVKAIYHYVNPMGTQSIKASVAYNALKDDNQEPLNLQERNAINIIKTDINSKNIEHLKIDNPAKYEQIISLMNSYPEFSDGISAVGLPASEEVPKWLIEFIDYRSIINDNLADFPLDSIGLNRYGKKPINYTNILKL